MEDQESIDRMPEHVIGGDLEFQPDPDVAGGSLRPSEPKNQEEFPFLPSPQQVIERFGQIEAVQQLLLTQLEEGLDYRTEPGNAKPTMLKPGAEKIAKLLGLSINYEEDLIEHNAHNVFEYEVKCTLRDIRTNTAMWQDIASCNSRERQFHHLSNAADHVDTFKEVARERALVGAALSVGILSGHFMEGDIDWTSVESL